MLLYSEGGGLGDSPSLATSLQRPLHAHAGSCGSARGVSQEQQAPRKLLAASVDANHASDDSPSRQWPFACSGHKLPRAGRALWPRVLASQAPPSNCLDCILCVYAVRLDVGDVMAKINGSKVTEE